jgi:hypothetical protein
MNSLRVFFVYKFRNLDFCTLCILKYLASNVDICHFLWHTSINWLIISYLSQFDWDNDINYIDFSNGEKGFENCNYNKYS